MIRIKWNKTNGNEFFFLFSLWILVLDELKSNKKPFALTYYMNISRESTRRPFFFWKKKVIKVKRVGITKRRQFNHWCYENLKTLALFVYKMKCLLHRREENIIKTKVKALLFEFIQSFLLINWKYIFRKSKWKFCWLKKSHFPWNLMRCCFFSL